MAFEEKTIESKVVYEGPIFKIRKHKVTAVNDQIAYRDILEHNGAAVMLPVKDDGKIVLVRQYRKTLERDMMELPAGKIDPGEDPVDAAARELKEETGFTAQNIQHLTTINPSCGYSTEMLHIYLCRGLTAGETSFDDTEDLEIFEFTADEIVGQVMDGTIQDAKTIVGILFARTAGEI